MVDVVISYPNTTSQSVFDRAKYLILDQATYGMQENGGSCGMSEYQSTRAFAASIDVRRNEEFVKPLLAKGNAMIIEYQQSYTREQRHEVHEVRFIQYLGIVERQIRVAFTRPTRPRSVTWNQELERDRHSRYEQPIPASTLDRYHGAGALEDITLGRQALKEITLDEDPDYHAWTPETPASKGLYA